MDRVPVEQETDSPFLKNLVRCMGHAGNGSHESEMTKLNTCIYTHSPLPEDMGDGDLANMILEARFETFPLEAEPRRRMLSTAVQMA